MEKVVLRNSDLSVSRFCMGGCPMGGYGWGRVSKSELVAAVKKALEIGINFFDSADVYGLGEAEKTLGEAVNGNRQQAIIATKFGVRVENGHTFFDNSPKWITQAVENSLRRLQTDYIDLYQIHYRDGKTPINEVIYCLERLKEKGCIRYYGLSNIHMKDMAELASLSGKFVSFQDEYSLACRKNESDMFKLAELLELTPLTWGSLGQGILTGKYDEKAIFRADDRRSRENYVNFHGERLLKNLAIVAEMRKISAEINKSVAAIAIRWILDYLPHSVVLVGTKNVPQLLANVGALGWQLNDDYKRRLEFVSGDEKMKHGG
ncbi:Aldo-keto reductase YhdN [Sporomusa silvacetica DSM 10669]|uniref:Aldo-keto reductase YhdN n=1 Tax=Sporomusa silvacetica DSM 10669 TaxID=1123289 RepID=A0ABZ3IGX9_9FIRM|nr:aldo/keto reductase [Sporomusa silvacetica]OZC21447.1 general stress protein 69 [Sporomusa silvacetica DSM 10669]